MPSVFEIDAPVATSGDPREKSRARASLELALGLAAALVAPPSANAEPPCLGAGREEQACREGAAAEPSPLPFAGYLSLDFASHYEYHGLIYAEDALITQAFLQLSFPVYEGDGWLRAAHLGVGGFFSLHGGDSSSGEGLFEADPLLSLSLELPRRFAVDLEYWIETSPNDSFSDIHELDLRLRYDDAPLWRDRLPERFGGFQPHALLGVELDGQNDLGNETFGGVDTDEGVYLELGVRPSLRILDHPAYPVTLTAPLRVGLSLSDYYENLEGHDDTFGFFEAAVDLGVPLAFLSPGRVGVEAHVSAHSFWIDGTLRDVNSVTGGATHEWIGRAGLRITF